MVKWATCLRDRKLVRAHAPTRLQYLHCRRSPVCACAQVCLTGHGWYDGTGKTASGASTGKQLQYIAFGAAVCEVRCSRSGAHVLRKPHVYCVTLLP